MSEIIVRKAVKSDMKKVHSMIVDLATFEGYPNGVKLSKEDLERDGFESERPYFFSIVAECPKTSDLVGYAICNFAYSSWSARALYIEDFYVNPELRGQKIGHRIFKEICKIGRDNDCHRIDWHVLLDNDIAMKFYLSHGAIDICQKEKRTCHRLYGDKILEIANSDD